MTARASGPDAVAAWAVPFAATVGAGASLALWAGGGLAGVLTGSGWDTPALSLLLVVDVLRDGPGSLWPAGRLPLVFALAGVLGALLLGPVVFLLGRRVLHSTGPARSLASASSVRTLLPGPAAAKARQLRPGLPSKGRLSTGDAGVTCGQLLPRGPVLTASWEDVVLAVMAPRAGKTTALAVPAVLNAPGPVVLTSNKADAWAATAQLRERDTGARVWTFDPQNITRGERGWTWDPLAELHTVEQAERLAGHFVTTVDDDHARDIWGPAATELLAALFLAAALDGRDLGTAYEWLQSEVNPTAATVLERAGYRSLGQSLRGTMQAPAETRGSVYFTARTATRCLRDPAITAWVTPDSSCSAFDPAAFVLTRETLFLLSKDGGGSAAPLVAALTDRVFRAGVEAAEDTGGRLDPPLVAVLDEAANVCKIADLPQLYSHLGSRGVVPITILQSYAQGEAVWGKAGMRALWSAATVKLLGAGLDDAAFTEDVSRLVGEHDVVTDSWGTSTGTGTGRSTRTRSTRRERILSAADLRALPKGTALLLATGMRPALVMLLPFYAGPRAREVAAATGAAVDGIAGRGVTAA